MTCSNGRFLAIASLLWLAAAKGQAQPAAATAAPPPAAAEASDGDVATANEVAAIRSAIEHYVTVFNAADAAGVAACWAADGVYVTPDGQRLGGTAAIQEHFARSFAEAPDQRLVVHLDSIRLLDADVALEEGTAIVEQSGQETGSSTYLAIHRRQDGVWRLDTVRETLVPEVASPSGPLDALGWLVGQWSDQSEPGVHVRSSYRWARGGQFLVNVFQVVVAGEIDLEGTQIIGWDPADRVVRSWLFDSDGEFGQGVWTPGENPGDWVVKTRSVLPSGGSASALNQYHRVDENLFTWQSSHRKVDGTTLPDVPPIAVRRQGDAP